MRNFIEACTSISLSDDNRFLSYLSSKVKVIVLVAIVASLLTLVVLYERAGLDPRSLFPPKLMGAMATVYTRLGFLAPTNLLSSILVVFDNNGVRINVGAHSGRSFLLARSWRKVFIRGCGPSGPNRG